MTKPVPPRLGLAPGEIIGTTLAIFFRRLPLVLLLMLPASLSFGAVLYLVSYELWDVLTPMFGSRSTGELFVGISMIATGTGVALATASGPMTVLVNAFQGGEPTRLRVAFGETLRRPIARLWLGLQIAIGVMTPFALVAWFTSSARLGLILTALSIAIGSSMIGRWGLGLPALSETTPATQPRARAVALSKGYRLALAGTSFLLMVIAMLFSGLFTSVLMAGVSLLPIRATGGAILGTTQEILLLTNACLGVGMLVTMLGIGLAVMHARMVFIKEPPDITKMITVFE